MNWFRYRLTPFALVFFMVALWMLQQEVGGESFLRKNAIIDVADGSMILRQNFLGFYLNNEKIGYSQFVLRESAHEDDTPTATEDSYLEYESLSLWEINAMGMPFEINIQQMGEVWQDLTLRSFRFNFESSGQRLSVLAAVHEGQLRLNISSQGDTREEIVDLNGPIYPTEMIPILVARDGLEPGTRHAYDIYDPLMMARETIVTSILAEETIQMDTDETVQTWKVEVDYKGFKTTSWITDEGEVVKEDSRVAGIPMTAYRETREEATNFDFISPALKLQPQERAEQTDLVEAASIRPSVYLSQPENVVAMRARIQGASSADLVFDNDRFQTLVAMESPDTYILQTRRLDYDAALTGVQQGPPPYETADDHVERYLQEESLLQVNHPRIRETALEITGDSQNPWQASKAIADWLYRNISKEFRVTIPSALEVLSSMKGDCNEHSTLFAALARSIGIPTKIAAGLVYLDGTFAYHAWNEVYVNGQWLPIDATLNRIEMDAAHIKLAEGALDSQAGLSRLIGNLDIEILDYEME